MLKLFSFLDFSIGSVLLNACDTVFAACLRGVAFRGSDNLAVLSLKTEAIFACLVNVHFKLGVLNSFVAFNGLVFDFAYAVVLNAFDTLKACSLGGVNLRGSDNFAVTCLEVELNTGCGLSYN